MEPDKVTFRATIQQRKKIAIPKRLEGWEPKEIVLVTLEKIPVKEEE